MCHCGNMKVEQTLNKSQHTKLTLEKKILQLLLPGFKLALLPANYPGLLLIQAVIQLCSV